jgi:hypothetical protein
MFKRLYVDNYKCLVNFELPLQELSLLLGPRSGRPTRHRAGPTTGRVEDWRVGRSCDQATFPAPSTSHTACGFPALRAPICFTPRLMGPIMLGPLSVRRGALDSR